MIHDIMMWQSRYQVKGHFYPYRHDYIPDHVFIDLRATHVALLKTKFLVHMDYIQPPDYVIPWPDQDSYVLPINRQSWLVDWMLRMEEHGWESLFERDRRVNGEWDPTYPSPEELP